jgi:hypothetical protein
MDFREGLFAIGLGENENRKDASGGREGMIPSRTLPDEKPSAGSAPWGNPAFSDRPPRPFLADSLVATIVNRPCCFLKSLWCIVKNRQIECNS